MEAAVAQKMNIGDCIQKVQKDVLSKCNERYAGKRYKGFIKFEFESNVINISVILVHFIIEKGWKLGRGFTKPYTTKFFFK